MMYGIKRIWVGKQGKNFYNVKPLIGIYDDYNVLQKLITIDDKIIKSEAEISKFKYPDKKIIGTLDPKMLEVKVGQSNEQFLFYKTLDEAKAAYIIMLKSLDDFFDERIKNLEKLRMKHIGSKLELINKIKINLPEYFI